MLCLKQCIDLCELTPEQAGLLSERASLPQIIAAQASCPRQAGTETAADGIEDVRCDLLAQLHAAEDFADLRRVAHTYRAFALARAAARA